VLVLSTRRRAPFIENASLGGTRFPLRLEAVKMQGYAATPHCPLVFLLDYLPVDIRSDSAQSLQEF
jgi:hypothetical protein